MPKVHSYSRYVISQIKSATIASTDSHDRAIIREINQR